MKDYSNYHDINIGNKLEHDGNLIFEASLNGIEGKNVIIDELETKAVITTKYSNKFGELKYIFARPNEINRGSLVTCDNENWLVTTIPNNNGVFKKGEIQLCNSTFPIQTDETSILLTDDEGNPILDIYNDEQFIAIGGEPIDVPCIVETSYSTKDDNVQLPLPDNSIKVTIQYNNSSCIALNYEFEMYDETYKISHIDKSKVINEVGLLIITAKVVASE